MNPVMKNISKNILSQIINPPQIISLSLQEAELLKGKSEAI